MMVVSDFLNFSNNKERIKLLLANAYQNFFRKFKLQVTPSRIQDFFLKLIIETVDYREKNKIERNDFLSMLIQLKNNGKLDGDEREVGKISFNDLVAQSCKFSAVNSLKSNFPSITFCIVKLDRTVFKLLVVFFLAGFETSSTALSYALYELALNQELQDRTRVEIEKVLAEHDGKITYDAIMSMEWCGQVISESLRKYPPGNVLLRTCTKEYQVPGTKYIIDKGSNLMLPMSAIHNDPEYFPNPKKFDPERFSPEAVKERNPFAFLPFGK